MEANLKSPILLILGAPILFAPKIYIQGNREGEGGEAGGGELQ